MYEAENTSVISNANNEILIDVGRGPKTKDLSKRGNFEGLLKIKYATEILIPRTISNSHVS